MTVVVRPSGRTPVRCPYCLDALELAAAAECAACRTRLHADCRAAAGGCTTLGCAAAPPAPRLAAAAWRPGTAVPETRRRREPPLWPWLGRGWLRTALAYLLAAPVALLTLVVAAVAGALVGAALDLGFVALVGMVASVFLANAAGHETVRWFRGEPSERS